MKHAKGPVPLLLFTVGSLALAFAAMVVPTDIQQPGTQPREASLESPTKCDNCHGGYNAAVEPAFNWRGSMMANAGRDPIFWATMAIAEQDFDGAGDLCIRCHSTSGWIGGRSTPTDGSALTAGDADGVECDACHKMTNPDFSEHVGVMKAPYIANKNGQGFYGSGMLSLSSGAAKLGPYANADARHQFQKSNFHRQAEFCGSCHDVSNPAVGDLAHNNGKQATSGSVVSSGVPGAPVNGKAAFNNLPFMYGVVERTFSEFKSGSLGSTPVKNYLSLPAEMRAGAVKMAYEAALVAGKGGDYEDGTLRTFTCQSCHIRPTVGQGANKAGLLVRKDLPLHDMTGGNSWAPDAILYQNANGTLRLGGGLNSIQIDAIKAGKERAIQQLKMAASLAVVGDSLKVINLTGHKLISGYPEGRRMWLNVKWYDTAGNLLREDGAYGPMTAVVEGVPTQVETLLSPETSRVYDAHYGMTSEWARQLLALGKPSGLPLSFDRVTGAVTMTLGDLGAMGEGTAAETFHFVLNNTVLKDNRIPPYGFDYEKARTRNALPVPASQYGMGSGTAGTYNHWDLVPLNPPAAATYGDIRLMYQSTSWEYVQFLLLANNRSIPFLANEGKNLYDAWRGTGMARPVEMARATWGTAPGGPPPTPPNPPTNLTAAGVKRAITLNWSGVSCTGYRIYYTQAGKLSFRAGVPSTATTYKDTGLSSRVSYTYVVTAWVDVNGNGQFEPGIDLESAPSNSATATAL